MNKKILITGISGFAGSHLAERLVISSDVRIFGTYLFKTSFENIESFKDRIELVELDLLDAKQVNSLVSKESFDCVYHLAALTSPAKSFDNPSEILTNNITAEVNVLEAIRKGSKKDTRVLIISSAEVYGMVGAQDLPIDEETKFLPSSPYAVSKLTQDFLGLQYYLSYGLDIVRVRPFNHIGPRQAPFFVVSTFCKQIAEIEKEKCEPVIKVGNLQSKRDFTDVRDMVRAYELLIEKGKKGEVYNIGSGQSHAISDILSMLLSFSTAKISIEQDQSALRPSDIPDLVCDSSRLVELTGWKPEIMLNQSLKDTLNYWRNVV